MGKPAVETTIADARATGWRAACPLREGFEVLVELVFDGERYTLSEMALGSGNRLLRFRSEDRRLAYAFFEAELSDDGAGRPKPSAGLPETLDLSEPYGKDYL